MTQLPAPSSVRLTLTLSLLALASLPLHAGLRCHWPLIVSRKAAALLSDRLFPVRNVKPGTPHTQLTSQQLPTQSDCAGSPDGRTEGGKKVKVLTLLTAGFEMELVFVTQSCY